MGAFVTCNIKRFGLLFLLMVPSVYQHVLANDPIELNWLGKNEIQLNQEVSWGVPFSKGKISADESFFLQSKNGFEIPVQQWPLAYWPDGTIKWMGFASVIDTIQKAPFQLISGKTSVSTSKILIESNSKGVEVNTGILKCSIPRQGSFLIDQLSVNNTLIAANGKLSCSLEHRKTENQTEIIRTEKFTSEIQKVSIEQEGPLRAVIKIEGEHRATIGTRSWLPFVVRFYFYAGQETVKMVHTFLYDGDEQKDFISSLGIHFRVPLREEIQNRHVRFSGQDNGLWAEPIQPMIGRGGRFVSDSNGHDLYSNQIDGQRIPNKKRLNAKGQNLLNRWAIWSDYKLSQPNANGFTIEKRTNAQSCWLPAGAGKRASGLVYVGDVSGGLAVGIKNFWESYPSALEVKNASSDTADLNIWLWSPDAAPMDLRHYDTIAHGLEEVYEDVQPGFSTPVGIARTRELTLFPLKKVPTKPATAAMANCSKETPLLVCTPQYLHDEGAFGIWSLPDTSTPFKQAIETKLNSYLSYYQKAIDQHNWYGFWDFGDVMHSYDPTRHMWRYDLGGMAWDNSELGTDVWLWYSFLRTGREDLFRMAEAMTRHTSEVDVYHLGRFAGLGSRHNVRHWGCGAKELRISQASYRRFYYYLTTDERTGDVMREVVDADYKLLEVDPMRIAAPLSADEKIYPTRARSGPDWLAAVSNWMTEWERTGDTIYRNKIITGMDCMVEMPYGFLTGPAQTLGYDPESSKLYPLSKDPHGVYNLATIMGGAQVVFELNEFIDHPEWQKTWLQYCRLYHAPGKVIKRDMKTGNEGLDGSYARPDRLAAYVYYKTGNTAFVPSASKAILGRRGFSAFTSQKITGPESLNPLDEAYRVGTNGAAQWSLNAIEILEMCGDQLPKEIPIHETKPGQNQ